MAPDSGRRAEAVCAVIAAALGGAVGWVLTFSGLGAWGLVIGLVTTVALILGLARWARARPAVANLLAYGFAFILLTWPLMWLLVGYIRYAITGESLGD